MRTKDNNLLGGFVLTRHALSTPPHALSLPCPAPVRRPAPPQLQSHSIQGQDLPGYRAALRPHLTPPLPLLTPPASAATQAPRTMISSSATTTPQRGPSLPTSLTPPSCACSRSISCRCGSCRVARVSARRRRHALGYPQMPPHRASREWPYQCAPLPPHFPGGGRLHATAAAACARRRSPCSRQACSRALYPSTSARGTSAAAARARRRRDALHAFSHTRSSRARTLPWYVILVHAWLSPALTRAPHHAHTHPPGPLAAGMLESAMSKHVGT